MDEFKKRERTYERISKNKAEYGHVAGKHGRVVEHFYMKRQGCWELKYKVQYSELSYDFDLLTFSRLTA